MYKLYVDRNENFECEISAKNASLKNSFARLIVESSEINMVFHGKIEGNKCVVPVKKLNGILSENTKGKMHLEVVVENTYFKPWESEYIVEEHTSLKVQVREQVELDNKPMIEIKGVSQESKPIIKKSSQRTISTIIAKEISNICELFGINSINIKREKRNDFKQLIKEYFSTNPEYNNDKTKIIKEVSLLLQ